MSKWNKTGNVKNPISFWIAIGSGVGLALNNLVVGIGIGVAIGAAFGTSLKRKQESKKY